MILSMNGAGTLVLTSCETVAVVAVIAVDDVDEMTVDVSSVWLICVTRAHTHTHTRTIR